MSTATCNLGISFGDIQHFHDGLGEFSRQFGLHVAACAPRWREEARVQVYLHLPERWHGMFGEDVRYLPTQKTQRILHRSNVRFDVWHQLHQHIRFRAPLGTRHCITTLHDLNAAYSKHGFSRWRALNKQVRLLKRADEIICISDHVLADLHRLTRLQTPACRIHNGVHSLVHTHSQPVAGCTEQPFLLHLGRMTPNKNVGCLIELAAHWPDKPFVFAGPRSGYTEGYRDEAISRRLNNVQFFFDVSEAQKAWLFAHCEGLLMPSLTEGFGLPAIEAMYFGKPVFLSRLTSLPEIGGDVASYFDAFTPAAMRQAVSSGLGHMQCPQQSEKIQRWAGQFTWERCLTRYADRYGSALGTSLPCN
jgi:glycosyltransferase involved in cell wall biosynthesis